MEMIMMMLGGRAHDFGKQTVEFYYYKLEFA